MKSSLYLLCSLALACATLRAADGSLQKADKAAPTNGATVTSDKDALGALDLDFPGLEKVKAAAVAGDLAAAQSAYLAYRRTASPVQWKPMPAEQPPKAVAQTDTVGDEICEHHLRNPYHFSSQVGDQGKDFNWTYNPVPNTDPGFTDEWTFCVVSRTQYWKLLGEAYWKTRNEKYAAEWVAQLADFAKKNPVNHQTVGQEPSLWRSLDAAIRVGESWPSAYVHFLNSPSFTPEAQWLYLKQIRDHALMLQAGLLRDPARSGNWVTTECLGLYTIGTLFPELREAADWRKVALDRITVELERVTPPDGMEAELTPSYHYVTANGFFELFKLAQLNQRPVPEAFRSKLLNMYRAPLVVMDQRGDTVPTNDSSPTNAQSLALKGLLLGSDPLLEWAASHGERGVQPPDSTCLPYAGFYAMRSGWKRDDMFLFFRGGPVGLAHEHQDMLEIVVKAWDKTLLPEPGSYNYDHSDWRRFAIGTASHNTIIVDGKWQHRPASKVPVLEPTGNPWVTTPLFDYVAATYNSGYQTSVYDPTKEYHPERWVGPLDLSVSHTRRVLYLRPYYALVLDTLDGTGEHTFDAHFHMDAPSARLDTATQAAFSQRDDDVQIGLFPLDREHLATDIVQGQKEPLLGWMPGAHRPIPTVRFRKQQSAPALFGTFVYPYRGQAPDVASKALPTEGDHLWAAALTTPLEKAEVVMSKNGQAKTFSTTSALLGKLRAEASGLVIRQPANGKGTFAGGWNLRSYRDSQTEFTTDEPATVLFVLAGNRLTFLNPGEKAMELQLVKPFTRRVTLPAGAWTEVSEKSDLPAATPALFPPFSAAQGGAPSAH